MQQIPNLNLGFQREHSELVSLLQVKMNAKLIRCKTMYLSINQDL